jgi:hypothetical protein
MRLGGLVFSLEVERAALGWHGCEAAPSVAQRGLESEQRVLLMGDEVIVDKMEGCLPHKSCTKKIA